MPSKSKYFYARNGQKYPLCTHGVRKRLCRPCMKKYMRDYDQTHRPQSYQRLRKAKKELKEEVRKLKDRPCTDCGIKYPYWIMQFDHVKGEKQGDVGYWVTHGKRNAALREIEKCELVCAKLPRK